MEEPRRLGGRYELGGVLGRGGMAEVYLGHDIRLGRAVAVKTLRADMARDPSFQARFRREAQSAASLNHPSIVAVYDTGEDYIDGVSIPYIVMEYVDGSTLRDLLHSGRRLLPERALEMTTGILQALEYSHRNGIVHRDIKPANVMLTRNGTVKVMDFGIARAMGDTGMTMTQTAAVIGTAQYLSPEQAKGEQVDARSDLYSTGCLLYELLTVRPPFIGDSPVAVAYQHVREEPQPPSVYDPELRPEYDAIVLKALAKDRDYRYQSADEMRADIERALDGLPVAAAQTVAYGAGPMGGGYDQQTQVYGGQPDQYGRTTAMPQQAAGGYGQTSLLPGVGQGYDAGGDGFDQGYDDGDSYGGRGDRRRNAGGGGGKNRATSWIILAVAGVLVLAGAYFVTKSMWGGGVKNGATAPQLIGQTWSGAESAVSNVPGNLKVVQGAPTACSPDTAGKGDVCSQSPTVGTAMANGATITVHISTGAPTRAVPSVVGQTVANATTAITSNGFTLGTQTQASSPTVPQGSVISQTPSANSQQADGSTVNLVVSSGVAQVQADYVVGQDGSAAASALRAQGLQVAETFSPTNNSTYPANEVVQETYNGNPVTQGMNIPANATINLVLNPAAPSAPPSTAASTNPPGGASGTASTPADPGNPNQGDNQNGNGNGNNGNFGF
ncbi:Stk1 family PASTA domain-containing Ser/Thr kinase [Streptacidiphilus sp. P02-A3a]|uniref:Stk1 family PASTA domain-containing Ser/Thr kinase n=1 Tax=Streptacidiphilus sp. P02-A3a TaxID=2704468 RepID=UPI0015FB4CF2|nr:Stk1 family PASTA domain-containing Ser/Thr kinase [Streptacidiphilus sp. P02-A3a]QMU66857.1 Stk1 family PASTA domain-containing Ser/Thr kinase [Streptacidiphilus sp. P02-A3a]